MDFDLYVRDVAGSLERIRDMAQRLSAAVVPSPSPLSTVVRVENEVDGLYIDLIDRPAGMQSFASVRSRGKLLRCNYSGSQRRLIVAPSPRAGRASRSGPPARTWPRLTDAAYSTGARTGNGYLSSYVALWHGSLYRVRGVTAGHYPQ